LTQANLAGSSATLAIRPGLGGQPQLVSCCICRFAPRQASQRRSQSPRSHPPSSRRHHQAVLGGEIRRRHQLGIEGSRRLQAHNRLNTGGPIRSSEEGAGVEQKLAPREIAIRPMRSAAGPAERALEDQVKAHNETVAGKSAKQNAIRWITGQIGEVQRQCAGCTRDGVPSSDAQAGSAGGHGA